MKSILSQEKRVFNANNSNAIISKLKNICWIFGWISGIDKKFEILWKKDQPQRWFFFEIKECKKRG